MPHTVFTAPSGLPSRPTLLG